jgi:hypothetical protein
VRRGPLRGESGYRGHEAILELRVQRGVSMRREEQMESTHHSPHRRCVLPLNQA